MTWAQSYPKSDEPALEQIAGFVASPLWQALCGFVETGCGAAPQVAYSMCSGAPGWNVKYKKGGRSLCVLYPREGFFTCLVCVGAREEVGAGLLLPGCCAYTRALFEKAGPVNGTRWLMMDVTSADILEDAKRLISLRAGQKGR